MDESITQALAAMDAAGTLDQAESTAQLQPQPTLTSGGLAARQQGGAIVTQPATQPATRTRGAGGKKPSNSNGKQRAGTSPVADPAIYAVTIQLPKADYDYFEQQAAAAPFEPTLARYLAWQLRQQAAAAREAAADPQQPLPLTYPTAG
jgi:hypothetical protein